MFGPKKRDFLFQVLSLELTSHVDMGKLLMQLLKKNKTTTFQKVIVIVILNVMEVTTAPQKSSGYRKCALVKHQFMLQLNSVSI